MKKRQSRRPARHRPLFVESLESRIVLDGNVRAFVSGGTLQIDGDSRDNEIVIEQTARRQFIVSSRDGSTTINGQTGPRTFTRVRNNLDVSLGRGNDVVEILGSGTDPLRVNNRLFVNTGNGADQVLLNQVHAIGLHVNTGSGDDLINVGNDGADPGLQVTKEAVIVTGRGLDDARIANSLFKRFVVLDMGANSDETTIQDTTVRKRSTVIGGSANDTLNREGNRGKIKFTGFERVNNSVDEPNLLPVAGNDSASVTRGGSVTINVASTDTAPGSTLNLGSIVITQAPTNGTAVANANGTVTYTNNGNAAATDSFQYTIKDADGDTSNVATVSITVNGPLAAVDDAANITEDATPNTVSATTQASTSVLTNDTGGTGAKTVSAVSGNAASVGQTVNGTFGTFRINADGTFTYTLDNTNATINGLNNGETRTDSIDYTVRDASNATDIGTLTVTIQGHTELAAVDDAATITEDATPNTVSTLTPSGTSVLTNDTGGNGAKTVTAVNGNAASVGQVVNGTFGTFRINSDGTFTYTLDNTNATINGLNNGETRTDSMNYTVGDTVATDVGTLTVTIQGHTDLVAGDDAATITEDATPNTVSDLTPSGTSVLTNDTGGNGAKTVTAVNGNAASVGQTINGTFGTFRINADGTFTYTLDNTNATINGLNNGETRTDSMNYTVGDTVTTDVGTLTVTINGHTELAAVDDAASITEDATPNTVSLTTPGDDSVLDNDTGGNGTKTVTTVNGSAASVGQIVNGQFGTFRINADGTFTYTLDNANATINGLNNGESRTDSMNYTVGDTVTTDIGTLTVTIQGHTDLVAGDDAATITEDATPNTVSTLTPSGTSVLTNDTGGNGAKTVTAVNGNAASVGQVVNGTFGTFRINADGTFTYTLDNANATINGLNNGETQTDSMNYTVGDTVGTDVGTLTVTIQGHTDLVAGDDAATITEDATPNTVSDLTPSGTSVLTNDTGGNGTKTVTAVNGNAASVGQVVNGTFGTFRINADGTFTYTLDNTNATINGLNNGETRTDSMNYTVGDSVTTDIGTLTVTIQGHTELDGVPDAATITEDAAQNTVSTTTPGDDSVLDNDTGGNGTKTVTAVNGNAANVAQVINGQFGTFLVNADGTFTYTLDNTNPALNDLDAGETALDSVNYTVGDSVTTDTATLTVTIQGANDALTAVDDTDTVIEDAQPNTATGDVLDNDFGGVAPRVVSEVNGVAGNVGTNVPGLFGTFNIAADGSYTYTLDNTNATINALNDGQTETDTIQYTLSDGTTTDIGILTITIQGDTD